MAIYDVNGQSENAAYNVDGALLEQAFDMGGNVVFESWNSEISVLEQRDEDTQTTYYVIMIPQTRFNGQKQYPFVYAPNGTSGATQSTLEMNRQRGFYLAVNGGRFLSTTTNAVIGTTIQNSVLIQQGDSSNFWQGSQLDYALKVLTIDANGNLGYADPLADANSLIENDIVSALHGFLPIVINFNDAKESIESYYLDNTDHNQRQIIGQYANGDYIIITCEGRNFNNSTGWTVPQATQICLSLGLKFAFMLDGGGSTETVIGDEQINTIYEGTYGRKVPSYIVFNGTDEFFVPNA